uniref:Putative secreted protein n=1 Tax=Amblyomma triste TaxID=251400 RepID=A0A023G223_AMBTT
MVIGAVYAFFVLGAAAVVASDDSQEVQSCQFRVIVDNNQCVVSRTLRLYHGQRHFNSQMCTQLTCDVSNKEVKILYCDPPYKTPGMNCELGFPDGRDRERPYLSSCCPFYTCKPL